MIMRSLGGVAAFLALVAALGLRAAIAEPPAAKETGEDAGATSRPIVVELFTSQGCAECPPADKLLGELSKRKDVIALTLPVTYWDMLGWKDTLADEANTARQRAYAKVLKRSGVYTPQIVVDGDEDVVGGKREEVLKAIAARTAKKITIPIRIKAAAGEVRILVSGGDGGGNGAHATIWVIPTLSHATVNVREGENKNRQLGYTNIVRDLKAIGLWKGQPVELDLPRKALTSVNHDGLAVILQRERHGQVIGAAMVSTGGPPGKE